MHRPMNVKFNLFSVGPAYVGQNAILNNDTNGQCSETTN